MRLWLLVLLAAAACQRPRKSPYVQLAVGDAHACARRADGRVACWGWNGHGQLGATDPAEHGPLLLPFVTSATDLAVVGGDTTCAVIGGGEVECWGIVWTRRPADSRQRLPGIRGAVRVVGGGYRACALAADGAATCWGPASADRANRMPGWPPAPDERMRGATAVVGIDGRLCARAAGRAFCVPPEPDGRLEPLEAEELAVLHGGGDSLCLLAGGSLRCRGLSRSLPAAVHGLAATGEAICGLDAASVLCVFRTELDSLPKYVPQIAWKPLEGFASPALLTGGGFGVCALEHGTVRCADPPRHPAADVPLPG